MNKLCFTIPTMRPLADGGWSLARDWTLRFRGEVFDVPKGFVTDGASIPRFLWRLCGHPMEVPRLYAALVHDWIYSGGDKSATREEADALFRDIQFSLGSDRFLVWAEWLALRMFGASHWYANKKQEVTK